jgi:hypothetical protein
MEGKSIMAVGKLPVHERWWNWSVRSLITSITNDSRFSDINIILVFAIEQNDPARRWLAARSEGLVNHLRNCDRQPPEVRQKAQLQKENTSSQSI